MTENIKQDGRVKVADDVYYQILADIADGYSMRKAGEKLAYNVIKPQLNQAINPVMAALGAKTSEAYLSALDDFLRENWQK